jgi:excisionase family DNA binding protein
MAIASAGAWWRAANFGEISMSNVPAEPILLSVEEFARRLRCAPGTVRKMIANGTLKTMGDGERLTIPARHNLLAAKNYLDLLEGVQEGLAEAQNEGLIKVIGVGNDGEIDYERTEED